MGLLATLDWLVIAGYFALVFGIAIWVTIREKTSRGTSKDYFVASHSIGPFMLLMSVFGTTMTAFASFGAEVSTPGPTPTCCSKP